MKLSKLKFQNYKSIKQSQVIDFSVPLITLIGKNGSGKTNVLDSIFTIFDHRLHKDGTGLNYRFFIAIDDNDKNEFKDVLDFNKDIALIEAYSSGEKNNLSINVNRIKSPLLTKLLKETEESIYSLATELKKELEAFNHTIKALSEDKPDYAKFSIDVDFHDEDIANSTNYGWLFSHLKNEITDMISKVKAIVEERIKDDELVLSNRYLSKPHLYYKYGKFELKYSRPKLTKFESKHIKVDEESIKKEISKINELSKEQRKKIDDLYSKLEKKLGLLGQLIDDRLMAQEDLDNKFESVLKKIISTCNPKIYYLRNENTQLFFKKQDAWISYYHSHDEKTMLETFVKYKYTELEQNELKKRFKENDLSEERIKEISFDLETFINYNLPPYEKAMIDRIKVSEELSFSIIEKSGDEIPFNSTNSGRRWYYTYFFVKGCLQPGDLLLMDEPANNLHPEAQIHIRKEIEEISKNNIVVMTTHSPYMISPFSNVYYVEMNENGSNLINKDNLGLNQIVNNLGAYDKDTLIGDILLNNELLPFKDIGNRIREELKEKNITQREAANEMNIDERELRNKLNGKHLTFRDVDWFCKAYQMKPFELIFKKRLG
jgi:ABC-type cobalamin/Fe3+-siderophores transport system ATPase subunit